MCTGNSARSQLAEAIVNRDYSDEFEAFSAGSSPKDIDPRTIKTLQEHGYSIENMKSKPLDAFSGSEFDYLITLCASAYTECATIPGVTETISWDISQPKLKAVNDSFELTFTEIEKRIHLFSIVHSDHPESEFDSVAFFKSLADKTRMMILALLYIEKELSVSELANALQEPQPTISRALAQFRKSGLLQDRRQGLWVYYSISSAVPHWATVVLDQAIIANHVKLQAIIKLLNSNERPKIEHL